MNETSPNLVTTYTFKGGKEHIVKMRVTAYKGGCQRSLELTVTDKYTAEDWQSSYDTAYIENLTHKTGNYKQFDIFVNMLQSGLLKTSECVSLDLLTFKDLELLRSRRIEGSSNSSTLNHKTSNRRYLILTYTVEFDRIHYPLPLEYCGPPDPAILQATIRRLEAEVEKLQNTGINRDFQRRIEQLTIANKKLVEENRNFASGGKGVRRLLAAIKTLENSVAEERANFRARIKKLRAENLALTLKLHHNELASRKPGDGSPALKRRTPPPVSSQSRRSNVFRSRSRSPSDSERFKVSSLSRGSSLESLKSKNSPRRTVTKSRRFGIKEIDFGNLESRIHTLQKMLRDGINLN
ncbi:coiled-coil domain-containing protein 61 isoform X1 [Cephus cinctus]|uniref:Centrosomal protein CCDC61 n=1 Tax=Cephus cinctus TaxID=211228 RepID=A0AAJ7RJJ5_CEPCN|nr:coiled-coil domain-containing protein 61 isoform X1 [Cephus cinctus]